MKRDSGVVIGGTMADNSSVKHSLFAHYLFPDRNGDSCGFLVSGPFKSGDQPTVIDNASFEAWCAPQPLVTVGEAIIMGLVLIVLYFAARTWRVIKRWDADEPTPPTLVAGNTFEGAERPGFDLRTGFDEVPTLTDAVEPKEDHERKD